MTYSKFLTISMFSLAGVLSTVIHYSILFILIKKSDVEPVIATCFGALSGGIVNYYINYSYTFKSHHEHVRTIVIFFFVAVVGLAINAAVMAIAFHLLSVSILLSQLLATALSFIWNFSSHKRWTF